MDNPDAVARDLLSKHEAGAPFRPFAAEWGIVGLEDAYAVQRRFVALLEARHGHPVGYKIGLTSARMQAMCNIDQPIGGVVLSDRVHRSGAVLDAAEYGRIGLEYEIGVRLGSDLPADGAPYDMDRIASAVDAVCAAVELVDDRKADYRTLDVLSLVADNSWNAGIVLGEWVSSWPDLTTVTGTVFRDGREEDRGTGKDVLGHPFAPLTWLANRLAAAGQQLRAGDIVLTGSLVTTRFPTQTEGHAFVLDGIGRVEVAVRVGG